MLKEQRDSHIDLLTSLALATGTFSLANQLGMSGAIAVVVAGLCFGTNYSHSIFDEASRKELDIAWNLIDEVLNVLLFMLIGFEILEMTPHLFTVMATLAVIPLSIGVRALSVLLSILPVHLRQWERGRMLGILTWGGLRGGISVSLALGLPPEACGNCFCPFVTVSSCLRSSCRDSPWNVSFAGSTLRLRGRRGSLFDEEIYNLLFPIIRGRLRENYAFFNSSGLYFRAKGLYSWARGRLY